MESSASIPTDEDAARACARAELRGAVWIGVVLAGFFGVFCPAAKTVSDFERGYFYGSDFEEFAVVSLVLLAGWLLLCALSDLVRRLGISMHEFLAAWLVQLCFIAAGYAAIGFTFDRMVERSLERAQAVVEAIQAFERRHGVAPCSLDELYPEFTQEKEPARLFEWAPYLDYELREQDGTRAVGGWRLRTFSIMNPIDLEYVPGSDPRPLSPGERRVGDWILTARRP
jgi:hypothetical protein